MKAFWQIPALALASAGAVAAPSTDQRLERVEAQTARLGELTLDVDELKRENRELRGALEELQFQVEGLKKRIREVAADFDQRLPQQAPAAAPRPAAPAQTQPGEPAAKPAASEGAADAADYQKAYKLLEQKKYKEAVAAFQAYLKKYPPAATATMPTTGAARPTTSTRTPRPRSRTSRRSSKSSRRATRCPAPCCASAPSSWRPATARKARRYSAGS